MVHKRGKDFTPEWKASLDEDRMETRHVDRGHRLVYKAITSGN